MGDNHPDIAQNLNNLASLYNAMERYSEAEPLYLRCLEIFVKTLPENHPSIQAEADVFLTTDDRLLKRASRLNNLLNVIVRNPANWFIDIKQNTEDE